MADKFLSRPDSKQRILRLDLSTVPVTVPSKGCKDHIDYSAFVVTAESDRLTYFAPDQFGEWQFATREHDPLTPLAVGPNDMLAFPWSRRNGVAATDGLGVVVFKRALRGHIGLFLDFVALGTDHLQLSGLIEIPLANLDIAGTGADIWARFTENELLIVTQAWMPLPSDTPDPPPPDPYLVLLRCPIQELVPDIAIDPAVWMVHIMDRGGFDLDVRLEEGHVWAVHRRRGEAASRAIDGWNGRAELDVSILDRSTNDLGLDLSSLVGNYPPVVLVTCELATGACAVRSEDIPSVERPQLHSVNPVIITGDRLHSIEVKVESLDGARIFTPKILGSSKWVIWLYKNQHWFTYTIGMPRHSQWPLHLEEIAGAQWLIDVTGNRLSVGTLASLQPVVMADYQVADEWRDLSFIIEDPEAAAVVTDFYRIQPDGSTESMHWVGRNELDVGHELIMRPGGSMEVDETMHPAEHTQFLPFIVSLQSVKADGDTVNVLFSRTRNTLGGLIVADQDLKLGLHAYADMGDGGGRVVFASQVAPRPPTIGDPYKWFPPEIMVEPIAPGRAWVELRAGSWINADLPGYFVPLNDMLRRSPVPNNELALIFLAMTESILRHFTPRSIGSGLQLMPDVLPFAEIMAGASGGGVNDLNPTSFDLDQATADDIQALIAAAAPASRVFRSRRSQPFRVSFTFLPGVAQVGTAITLTATAAPPAAAGAVTFSWTFTFLDQESVPSSFRVDPITGSGATQTLTFPLAGDWRVDLVATAADGTMSTCSRRLPVAPTLWDTVWMPQASISNQHIEVGSTTLEVSKFRFDFVIDAEGDRSRVTINYLDEHRSRLRFGSGREKEQGRIGLQLPVVISSTDVSLKGPISAVLKLNSLEASFNYERLFTPSITTSDRRSLDLQSGRTYAALDSQGGQTSTPRQSDVETVRRFAMATGRLVDFTPNAIAARPVDVGSLTLDDVDLDTELSDVAGGLTTIFSVIISLGLASVVVWPIIVAITIASPLLAIAGLGLLVLVGIAIGLGLGAFLRRLARRALTNLANSMARAELSRGAILTRIREGMDEAGLMTYAGEGVSESIAIMAIRKAIEDGHAVTPPLHDQPDPDASGQNMKPDGRERFRDQFFETIAVGDGVCRVQLRVP